MAWRPRRPIVGFNTARLFLWGYGKWLVIAEEPDDVLEENIRHCGCKLSLSVEIRTRRGRHLLKYNGEPLSL